MRADSSALQPVERELFDSLPVGLYRTAPDGRLLYANRSLVTMLGYADRDEFMTINAASVYENPDDRERWRDLLAREGDGAVFEMRDRRKNGSLIWVRDIARAVRDRSGSILCYEGTLENITARREADRYLVESEGRFRRLAEVSEDILWEWDLASGQVRWSAALRAVLGHRPEDVGPGIEHAYRWWRARIHPDDRDRVCAAFHHCIRAGEFRCTAEYRFRRANGSYARLYDRCRIERDAQKLPTRLIGSLIDLARGAVGPTTTEPRLDLLGPPVSPTPDDKLMEWAAAGDKRAFGEIYNRHSAQLFSMLRFRVDDEADAEELVADTFLEAWLHAASFDANRGSVGSWLACIGRSLANNRWRKWKRRQRLDSSPLEGSPVSEPPSDQPDEIQSTLLHLPQNQRQAIEMAFFGGLSHSEIAQRLEAPLGTVKTRIRAGIARMRDKMSAPRGSASSDPC